MATANDKEILNAIFNPLLPSGSLQFDETVPDELPENEEIMTVEVAQAKQLELDGIAAAEKENYGVALDLLSRSIKLAPQRASGFNNRAQILRLIGKVEEAKQDLKNAINLSGGKGRAACQAYCQRGLIAIKENRNDDAKADFEAAVELGSQFAKAQLVQMNPYAALCNKMLKGVFERLQQGLPTDPENVEAQTKN